MARIQGMLNRASLKRRESFLESLGKAVGNFCSQIGAVDLDWQGLKERLGEEGWQRAVVFTTHMYQMIENNGDEAKATPWRLMTIALSPARRATDASEDQLKFLDRLIEEAQRHCAREEKIRQGNAASGN